MITFHRLVAIGAIAVLTTASAGAVAIADTPPQYVPQPTPTPTPTPVPSTPVVILGTTDSAGIAAEAASSHVAVLATKTTNAVLGAKGPKMKMTVAGAGTYAVRFTGKLPHKKLKTLSKGSATVAVGSTITTVSVQMKTTNSGTAFRKAKTKAFGHHKVPVNVVVTYTPLTGVPATVTLPTKIKN
jgi:hypothetical protein